MHVSSTGAGRDAFDLALSRAPEHLRPAFLAVRDHGCGLMVVAQSRERFAVPADRPHIVMIGDDMAAALGPGAFHTKSLWRYLARCQAVLIAASAPMAEHYAAACSNAVLLRQDVAIVETRPERQAEWMDLIRNVSPTPAPASATRTRIGAASRPAGASRPGAPTPTRPPDP